MITIIHFPLKKIQQCIVSHLLWQLNLPKNSNKELGPFTGTLGPSFYSSMNGLLYKLGQDPNPANED